MQTSSAIVAELQTHLLRAGDTDCVLHASLMFPRTAVKMAFYCLLVLDVSLTASFRLVNGCQKYK